MSSFLNRLATYDLNQSHLPEIQYVDLSILNGDLDGTQSSTSLKFVEHRTSPFIESPQDYYLSVIRFKIDTLNLPIMQCHAKIGQSDPNLLTYSFTMSYQDYVFQQNIVYQPQDLSARTPAPPVVQQDNSDGYYYVYSYQWFIQMCNTALQSCFDGLLALAGTLPTNLAPWLTFDTASKEIVLNADILGFEQSLENPIKLFVNGVTHSLFSSFNFLYYGDVGVQNGQNFQFVLKNQNSINVLELDIGSTTYNIVQAYQEGSCVELWNPVQSIVITSSTLPIQGTLTATPQISNAPLSSINTSQNLSTPVISDFQVGDMEYRPYVQYTPYYPRLIEMYSRTSQMNISVEIYWKNAYGELIPMILPPNTGASIKLAFFNKSLYKN